MVIQNLNSVEEDIKKEFSLERPHLNFISNIGGMGILL
jgi:hypothetical protein